jgi:hypothetical protein
MRVRNLFDPGPWIRDSGWKNSDPGPGINILDPQHCKKAWILICNARGQAGTGNMVAGCS